MARSPRSAVLMFLLSLGLLGPGCRIASDWPIYTQSADPDARPPTPRLVAEAPGDAEPTLPLGQTEIERSREFSAVFDLVLAAPRENHEFRLSSTYERKYTVSGEDITNPAFSFYGLRTVMEYVQREWPSDTSFPIVMNGPTSWPPNAKHRADKGQRGSRHPADSARARRRRPR